ncbi:MAG TPA: hypothetical protein VH309_10975 [Elusimicrobiota bacterium]|jgi:hypothetical protein|nr:hypothetical protein [Elusimicrobiota bacterium]
MGPSPARRLALTAPLLFFAASAAAGPPFQTDDPDPVPYRRFEAYAFELSDGTRAGGTSLEFPGFEMNWGALPNTQLHVVAPMTSDFAPAGAPAEFGLGDTELGVKYRFVKETDERPEVGVFPFLELPSGSAARGLGQGRAWWRLPLWIQKSWGPWTSYGGGGAVVSPAPGYADYAFAGWLLQRAVTGKLTLGGEVFGHGAEGLASTSTRASTMADFGGFYSIRDGFQLLFAGGRSFAGQDEVYTYVALYWTWGEGAPPEQASNAFFGPNGSKDPGALLPVPSQSYP